MSLGSKNWLCKAFMKNLRLISTTTHEKYVKFCNCGELWKKVPCTQKSSITMLDKVIQELTSLINWHYLDLNNVMIPIKSDSLRS